MASDACDKFVGPMPIELFLSNFVPQAPNTRPTAAITFAHSAISQTENQIASMVTLIQLIEDARLCPNLKFINTTSCRATNLRPDISIYSGTDRNGPWTCASNPPPPEWRAVDLWIEDEMMGNDVFRDLEQMETVNEGACRVSGQLIAYISDIHCSPFRVFSFSVVLFGETGCLLRWDRSGVVYTEPFNWSTQPSTLFGFLWRLNFLSDVKCGCDTTVTSVGDDEADAALSKLRTYQGLENVAKADLHKFLVRDDCILTGRIKYYITPSADFWRTECDGIQKEGDVYRELNDAHVPNIAKLGLTGDIPLLLECGGTDSPAVQRTMTQQFLVLETLGSPLHTFRSTWELCKVIRDTITAHTKVYERVGTLHRDVSAGNILITEDGSGILIDWDLSKVVKDQLDAKIIFANVNVNEDWIRGTWQFVSIARLRDSSARPHEVSDDLESFFWVLLYMTAKCRSIGKVNLSQGIQSVFDQSDNMDDDGIIRGRGARKTLLDIIEELRTLFSNLYRYVQPFADTTPSMQLRIKSKRDQDESVQDALKKLRSSENVLSIINEHLASRWDIDDDRSLYKVESHPGPATSGNRRKRKAEDDGRDFQ
ncbi:hypothetical protein EDB87DRAFT_1836142 [Lactarius vividus]|nr:hypothetical protein EDB87DRAFT_1836142 [Lactarius vividus]